jgi:3-hydroxyisobutyrate dehydrogenase-like beta-hydroxyacid dehydrogenase
MGKKIFRMGKTGKGQVTKLAMNLQIAMIFEGLAEALTLAAKLGVDSQQLLSLIETTIVKSGVVEYKAPFVLQRDFTPNFPLRLMHKENRLTLEAAKEARVKLPGLETVEEIHEMAKTATRISTTPLRLHCWRSGRCASEGQSGVGTKGAGKITRLDPPVLGQ